MRKSKLEGPFAPAESGAIKEGVIEVIPPSDQLAIQFSEEPAAPKPPTPPVVAEEKIEKEPKPNQAPQIIPHVVDAEPSRTAGSIFDLPVHHLSTAEPIVYEHASRGKQALDRYHMGSEKVLKSFRDFNALHEIFTMEDTAENKEKLLQLQEKLYERYLQGISFPDMIATYLSLAKIVNKIGIHVQRAGRNAMHIFFINSFSRIFAVHFDVTERERDFLETYINKTMIQNNEDNYWRGMMQAVGVAISNYVFDRDYILKREQEQTEKLTTTLENEQGELQNLAQELLDAIRTQRRFGLRSSFYQDGLFHEQSEGWVMMHPFEFEKTRTGTLASIFLASRESVLTKGIVARKVELFKHEAMKSQVETGAFDSKIAWTLALDGELYIASGIDRISVREIFHRLGQEPLYDLIRLSFIARVHDLVVPGGAVDRLPSPEHFAKSVQDVATGKISPDQFLVVARNFIVQRVKYIKNPDQMDKDATSEEQIARQKVGEKPLAGTIYELPKGSHRTAYADKNFLEHEEYEFDEIDPTRTWTYRKPFDMPLYTHKRIVPVQKTEDDNS